MKTLKPNKKHESTEDFKLRLRQIITGQPPFTLSAASAAASKKKGLQQPTK